MRHGLFTTLILFLSNCSLQNQPCSEGGDVSWDPPITGNMECYQKKGPPFVHLNHGRFRQWNKDGKLVLTGSFTDGKRDGQWVYLNEKGETLSEKNYLNGIEVKNIENNKSSYPIK